MRSRCAGAAVLYGLITSRWLLAKSPGNQEMQDISAAVQEGAQAYLKRQYTIIGAVAVVLAIVLAIALDIETAIGFVIGGTFSAAAGFIGMNVSVRSNARVAESARGGVAAALQVAFRGGAVTGMLVAGLALLGVAGYYGILLLADVDEKDAVDALIEATAPDTYVVAALPSLGRCEVERMSDAAISSVLRQLQQPGSSAGARAGSPVTVTYAPVYFPGTPSIGEARSITVAAGDVREDLSFTITAFPAAIIRGRVVGLDGAPTQAVTLTLEGIGPALPAGATGVGRINQPDRNGEFEVRGVSPGMYRLRARAGGVKLDANGKMLSARGDAQTQFAMADVSVAGAEIDGVVLALQEGHRFAGTLTADGSAAPPALTGAFIRVEPITNGIQSVLAGTAMPGVAGRDATVDQAGRFAVMGLEPFNYDIQVTCRQRRSRRVGTSRAFAMVIATSVTRL